MLSKLLAVCFTAVTFAGQASAQCVSPPAGLAAWWTGNAPDAGEVFGRMTSGDVLFTPGKVGQAFRFTAQSGPLSVADGPDFNLPNFSVEVWVRRSDVTITTVSRGAYPGGNILGYGDSWNLVIADDGKATLLDRTILVGASSGAITDTEWHHVAVTKNGENVQFYIDGGAAGSAVFAGELPQGSGFAISGLQNGAGAFNTFLGDIDELSVYNRAITADEVSRVFNAAAEGKCSTDLTLLSQPSIVRAAAGSAIPVTLQLSGRGEPAATNVIVSLTGPQGVVFSGLTPTRGTADASGSSVTWDAGTVGDKVSGKLDLTATISAPGSHFLNATVTSGTEDIRATNNSAVTRIDIFESNCAASADGLVAFYDAESFNDYLGGGALINASGTTLASGWKGSSFRFTRVPGEGLRSQAPLPVLSNFTYQVWMKREGEGDGMLFNSNGGFVEAGITATGELYFVGDNIYHSTRRVADNQWHHLAWARQEGTLTFYLDGATAGVNQVDPAMQIRPPFAIGSLGDLSGPGFQPIDGLVDEVALFDRALTAQEISRTFLAGANGICAEDIAIAANAAIANVPLFETNLLRLSITNSGSLSALGVTLTNTFPSDVEILSTTGATPVAIGGGVYRSDIGIIPPGAVHEVVFAVSAGNAGQKQVTFAVGRSDHDLATINNSAVVTFTAAPLTASVGSDVSIPEPDLGSVAGSFAIKLNLPSEVERTVYFHWSDLTATSGVDYVPSTNRVVFAPGVTNVAVDVSVLGDFLYEGEERFQLELDSTNSIQLGASVAVGRIIENDTPPAVRLNDVTVVEGNKGTTKARFEISVTGPFEGNLQVPYFTTNITATAGEDYESVQGVLVFTKDARVRIVEAPIFGDVTAEANETFVLVVQAPTAQLRPQCIILDDDAAIAGATALVWDAIASGDSPNNPIQGRITARHADGSVDTSYNQSVQLAAIRGVRYSPVVITEIDIGNRDTVELQNVSSSAVDLSGWKVYFYDSITWPAPAAVFTFTNSTTLPSKGVVVITEGATPRANGYVLGGLIAWMDFPTNTVAAVLVEDAAGNNRDFVAIDVPDTSEILDPHPIDEPAWNDATVPANIAISGTYQRTGAENHHSPQDWSARTPSIGTGLPALFTDAELLPVTPNNVSLNSGVGTGNVSGLPASAPLTLVATDVNGRMWYSNPFTPDLPNDVSVTLFHPGSFVYGGLGTVISLVVSNPGPDIATNVVADLWAPSGFGPNTVSASQGTVARVNSGTEVRVRGTLGNIAPASAATVNLNIPVLPSRFDNFSFTSDPVTFQIHGNTTNLTGDPNLSNNTAVTTNEISRPAAIPRNAPISWWPGELNTLDAAGRNPLWANDSVSYAPGRAGFGFKLSGDALPLYAEDSSSLNITAADDFMIELWARIDRLPADGIVDLIRKLPDDPSGNAIGWRLFIERNTLYLYYRDSAMSQPALAKISIPSSERWLCITVTGSISAGTRLVSLIISNTSQNAAQIRVTPGDLSNTAPLIVGGSLVGMIDEVTFSKGSLAGPLVNVFASGGQGKTPSGVDLNANGIPDAWDQAATVGALPGWEDRDGDASFDWQEFVAGTNPVDATSVLKLSPTLRTDGRVDLKFPAVPGRFYNIDKTPALDAAPIWTTIRSRISVTTSNTQTVVPNAPVDGFYRVYLSN
ncbi:MAG TPA: LamG-like jellyroll fold domain-containing protein [Verrucomicrobiae bacterium]|nr:LamG-like jellyroll fold domain-containing protein [Verrucomicrobiae bacterium]